MNDFIHPPDAASQVARSPASSGDPSHGGYRFCDLVALRRKRREKEATPPASVEIHLSDQSRRRLETLVEPPPSRGNPHPPRSEPHDPC